MTFERTKPVRFGASSSQSVLGLWHSTKPVRFGASSSQSVLGLCMMTSWWRESNPRPAVYKTAALPAELHQHSFRHPANHSLFFRLTEQKYSGIYFNRIEGNRNPSQPTIFDDVPRPLGGGSGLGIPRTIHRLGAGNLGQSRIEVALLGPQHQTKKADPYESQVK